MKYKESSGKLRTLWYNQSNLSIETDKEISTLTSLEDGILRFNHKILGCKKTIKVHTDWRKMDYVSSYGIYDDAYPNYRYELTIEEGTNNYIELACFPVSWLPYIRIEYLVKGIPKEEIDDYGTEDWANHNCAFHIYNISNEADIESSFQNELKKIIIPFHYYIIPESPLNANRTIYNVYCKTFLSISNPNVYY